MVAVGADKIYSNASCGGQKFIQLTTISQHVQSLAIVYLFVSLRKKGKLFFIRFTMLRDGIKTN
jgi:hypothetical protein